MKLIVLINFQHNFILYIQTYLYINNSLIFVMVNPLIKDIIRLCSIHHQVRTNNTKVFTTLLSINDDRQIVQISPIV